MIGVSPKFAPSTLLYYEEIPQDVQILLNASRSSREAFDWEKAYARALDVYEIYKEENTHVCLALAQIHLADCYSDVGEIGEAIDLCKKASEIFQRQPIRVQQHNEAVAAYALGVLHTRLPFRDDVQILCWYQEALTLFKEAKKLWAKRGDQSHFSKCDNVINDIEEQIKDIRISGQTRSDALDILPLGSTETSSTTNYGYVLEGDRVKINETIYYLHSGTLPSRNVDDAHYCFALPVREWQQAFPAAQDSDYVVVRLHWLLDKEQAKSDNAWMSGAVWSPNDGWDVGDFTTTPEGKILFHSRTLEPQIMGNKDVPDADRKAKDSTWARKGHIIGLLKPDTASSSEYPAPPSRPSPPSPSELPADPLPWEHDKTEEGGVPGGTGGDQGQNGPTSPAKSFFPTQIKVFDPVWLFSDDLDALGSLLGSSGRIGICTPEASYDECSEVLQDLPVSQIDLSVPEIEMSVTIHPRQVDVRCSPERNSPASKARVVNQVQKFVASRRHPLYFFARKGWLLVAISIAFILLLPMALLDLLSEGSNVVFYIMGIFGIFIGATVLALAFAGRNMPNGSHVTLWKWRRDEFSRKVQRIAYVIGGPGIIFSCGAFVGSLGQTIQWGWLILLSFVVAISGVIWLFGFSMQRAEY